MDREDVIRMANDAGMDFETDRLKDALVRFSALVAAAERERCAKMLDDASKTGRIVSCLSAAKAIRALP